MNGFVFLFILLSELASSSISTSALLLNQDCIVSFAEWYSILLGNRSSLLSVLPNDDCDTTEKVSHYPLLRDTWLDHTDGVTQNFYLQTMSEAASIEFGWVQGNPHCNSDSFSQPLIDCSFHRIVDQYRVADKIISTSNLLGDHLTNLQALTFLMVDLFNTNLYYQALSLSKLIYYEIIPNMTFTTNSSSTSSESVKMHLQIQHSKLSCLTVQFEVMRERNNFCQLPSKAVELLYQALILRELDEEINVMVYRLRFALSIPSVPLTAAASSELRQLTLTSLQLLASRYEGDDALLSEGSFKGATPFYMAHQGLNDLSFQVQLAKSYLKFCPNLAFIVDHLPPSVVSLLDQPVEESTLAAEKRIIKLGFVSGHFFLHSIGRIMIDTLYQLTQISTRFNDPSSGRHDDITAQYKFLFGDRFVHMYADNLTNVRHKIADDRLDFLMYTDLGMEINSYLLAFSRLAPIQAMWWGHPISSGLVPSLDYFFGLEVEDTNAAWEQYSEQLVRFQFVNTIPFDFDDWNNVNGLSDKRKSALKLLPDLGMPQDAVIVSVLGRLFKIHPDFVESLSALLLQIHRLDHDRKMFLVFFAEKLFDFNQQLLDALEVAVNRLSGNKSETVSILRRVKFLHYGKFYFPLLSITRVVLDTYPYGGCISSHDAFFHAIPIITLPSNYLRGRFTLALYQQLGYLSTIVPSVNSESFVKTTLPFLFDDKFYEEQRQELRQQIKSSFQKNFEVAKEWSEFIIRLFL